MNYKLLQAKHIRNGAQFFIWEFLILKTKKRIIYIQIYLQTMYIKIAYTFIIFYIRRIVIHIFIYSLYFRCTNN